MFGIAQHGTPKEPLPPWRGDGRSKLRAGTSSEALRCKGQGTVGPWVGQPAPSSHLLPSRPQPPGGAALAGVGGPSAGCPKPHRHSPAHCVTPCLERCDALTASGGVAVHTPLPKWTPSARHRWCRESNVVGGGHGACTLQLPAGRRPHGGPQPAERHGWVPGQVDGGGAGGGGQAGLVRGRGTPADLKRTHPI